MLLGACALRDGADQIAESVAPPLEGRREDSWLARVDPRLDVRVVQR